MTDELEILNKRLKETADKFKTLKESGMDEEILKIYLKHKTKLSMRDINSVLKHTEEFYDKIMKEELIKGLEDKQ